MVVQTPDVATLFRLLHQHAVNDLVGTDGLRLAKLFAWQPDGGMTLFALDMGLFDPHGPKQKLALQLRDKLRGDGYTAYGFYTEVWVSHRQDRLPEDDPARDEALMIVVGTRDRGFVHKYRMVKTPKGKIKRLSEMPVDPDEQGGRFGHLLTSQAWDGMPSWRPAAAALRH